MYPFIPGLELASTFYHDAVKPLLNHRFPGLAHSAARLDYGSDVLGFDTSRSMDHDWGPKFTLFLSERDFADCAGEIDEVLRWGLPFEVRGIPTNFSRHGDGPRNLTPTDHHPVEHAVTITTPARFYREYLGVDPLAEIGVTDWLALPQQRLRTVASGRVFHDGLNQLEPARQVWRWYPRDVWLYLMANQWQRIDQDAPFMGRCGDVGDDLGSRLVAARLVRDVMRLCFLIEQQYAPYAKWFGTAFARLGCAAEMQPLLARALAGDDWHTREQSLSAAYEVVMRLHNALRVTPVIEPVMSPFFSRPYLVPHADRFVDALHSAIRSEAVKRLPRHAGAVEQFVDSTDVLESVERCRRLAEAAGAFE